MKKLWKKLKDIIKKLISLNDTPYGIALGFWVGAVLSIIPTFGAGMIIALALAPFIKANLTSTYIGTLIVNPINGLFVYYLNYIVGGFILGSDTPSWEEVKLAIGKVGSDKFWKFVGDNLAQLYIGSIVLALVVSTSLAIVIFYGAKRYKKRHSQE